MKKNYNRKKKAVVIMLAFLAVCLAGGLFRYINVTGDQPQEIAMESTSPVQSEVAVPEIITSLQGTQHNDEEVSALVSSSEDVAEETTEIKEETSVEPSAAETQSQKKAKPSDGKPKSPAEATPPAEPPTNSETTASTKEANDEKESSTENTSQPETKPESSTGSPNSVYVPGFGNIDPSGSVEGSTSHTDGDWNKQIGDM